MLLPHPVFHTFGVLPYIQGLSPSIFWLPEERRATRGMSQLATKSPGTSCHRAQTLGDKAVTWRDTQGILGTHGRHEDIVAYVEGQVGHEGSGGHMCT